MNHDSRILVTGAKGLVGTALVKELRRAGFMNLLTPEHYQLDLLQRPAVEFYFKENRIEYVFHCAGLVGGIGYNSKHHTEFLYENATMGLNVIKACDQFNARKLLFLGSSCVYPRGSADARYIREEFLGTGGLEPTNEGYALAKIVGLKLCEYYYREHNRKFISAMPTNCYGPFDTFDLDKSHVIPAMMRRFHQAKRVMAKEVSVWGSGKPIREFIFSEDLAKALIHIMLHYDAPETINVGAGVGISIFELACLMKEITGFQGDIEMDLSKPDGMPRKVLDVGKLARLGFHTSIGLEQGLRITYDWAQGNDAI